MVDRQMKQKDVVDEIKLRTGYNKKDLRVVFEVLEDIIIENMNTATYDDPSEIILFHGWSIGAKRFPEREWREPKFGGTTITPAKLIPYCKLKKSFRHRLNKWEQTDIDEDEELDDDE